MDKDHERCEWCNGTGYSFETNASHHREVCRCVDPPSEPWPCEGHAEWTTSQDVGEQYGPEEPEKDRFERFLRTGK